MAVRADDGAPGGLGLHHPSASGSRRAEDPAGKEHSGEPEILCEFDAKND